MPKLPEIKPKQVEKVLYKLGFSRRNGKGSHIVFKHTDGRRTVIPVHNHPIRIGTLKAIRIFKPPLEKNNFSFSHNFFNPFFNR